MVTEKVQKKEAYHHGDLRQTLLNATQALVEAKGPMGFSVSEAAREAGVSTAAPYRHFSDRGEMLMGVAAQGMARMTAGFHEALKDVKPGTVGSVAALGVSYVRFADAEPGVFRLMFAAHEEDSEEARALGQACYDVVLGQVAAYLGHDEIDQTVLRTTFPLWALVHGLAFLRIDSKADVSKAPDELADIIMDATRRLLGAPAD